MSWIRLNKLHRVNISNFTTLIKKDFATLIKKDFANSPEISIFALSKTVDVAQLVRASVCGTEGRGFEPHHLPGFFFASQEIEGRFLFLTTPQYATLVTL